MDGRTQEAALWKALTAYQELVMEPGAPYREVKSALLEAMGVTIEQARQTIWLAKINVDDGPELVLKKVVRAVNRIKTDLTSPEYAAKEIFKGFLIHHFSEETRMMLESHKEETTHQQIQTLQRLWKSKDLYAKRTMLRNDPSSTQQTDWRRRDSGPPKDSWTVYKIAVPHSKSWSQNIHINRLKPWHTPSDNLFRVAVGQDSVGSEELPGRVALGQSGMAEAQKLELGKVLKEFGGVVCERLGQAIGTEHEIDRGQLPPVQAYPYRIPPNWKSELRGEIKKLLDDEIIAPITCPRSAPMVPIRRTGGSLRLCIDYRKLNKATVSDPYQMPRVDSLLDSVAEARSSLSYT